MAHLLRVPRPTLKGIQQVIDSGTVGKSRYQTRAVNRLFDRRRAGKEQFHRLGVLRNKNYSVVFGGRLTDFQSGKNYGTCRQK